jgi:hypothetical protein
MSRVLSLAGFEVTLIGRFWVIPEAQNIRLYPLEDARIPVITSLVKWGVFCLLLSTAGMSTNSWFHLRGKSSSPSSLTAEATNSIPNTSKQY